MFRRLFGRTAGADPRNTDVLRRAADIAESRGIGDGVAYAGEYVETHLFERDASNVMVASMVIVQLGKGIFPKGLISSAVTEVESEAWGREVLSEAGAASLASTVAFEDVRRRLFAHYRQFYRFAIANVLYRVVAGTYPENAPNEDAYEALAMAGVLPVPWKNQA